MDSPTPDCNILVCHCKGTHTQTIFYQEYWIVNSYYSIQYIFHSTLLHQNRVYHKYILSQKGKTLIPLNISLQ